MGRFPGDFYGQAQCLLPDNGERLLPEHKPPLPAHVIIVFSVFGFPGSKTAQVALPSPGSDTQNTEEDTYVRICQTARGTHLHGLSCVAASGKQSEHARILAGFVRLAICVFLGMDAGVAVRRTVGCHKAASVFAQNAAVMAIRRLRRQVFGGITSPRPCFASAAS